MNQRSRCCLVRAVSRTRKLTSHLRALSLKAFWNWTATRAQKPARLVGDWGTAAGFSGLLANGAVSLATRESKGKGLGYQTKDKALIRGKTQSARQSFNAECAEIGAQRARRLPRRGPPGFFVSIHSRGG